MADDVAFADLTVASSAERADLCQAVQRVLLSGWYLRGPEVEAFEDEFAQWLGARHCVGVGSGTDAIEVGLRALDVGPGAEVITQANTCVPTVAAIQRAGATPVLCDVSADSGLMDVQSLQRAITRRTGAIIPVHLYGQCCDMRAILTVADLIGVPVVEDCAQAHGARSSGRMAGTWGALGAYSFYPTKNLGALGDAGAVVCSDPELARRVRSLCQYGERVRNESVMVGVNSRLDEVQAAVLRVKLRCLDRDLAHRRRLADRYREAFGESTTLRPLQRGVGDEHAFHLFVCIADDREAAQGRLAARGIQTMVHYPRAIHQHPVYEHLGRAGDLVTAEALAGAVVSLPLHPGLGLDAIDRVVAAAR